MNDTFLAANDSRGPWMQTHSGAHVHLLTPEVDEIRLLDIAHALSRIPRFTGHTRGHYAYSVAQHSVWVAETVPGPMALAALLHDAHEAYLGDIATPVKLAINMVVRPWFDPVAALKNHIQCVIHAKFRLPFPLHTKVAEIVHEADIAALEFERAVALEMTSGIALSPDEAKALFLDCFRWSGGYLHARS